MARSPFSRNRAFERIAIPVLLVLFVVVAGRQLRKAVSHNDQHHVERVQEHRTYHSHADRREARREVRRQHRTAVAQIERENEREVDVLVQID